MRLLLNFSNVIRTYESDYVDKKLCRGLWGFKNTSYSFPVSFFPRFRLFGHPLHHMTCFTQTYSHCTQMAEWTAKDEEDDSAHANTQVRTEQVESKNVSPYGDFDREGEKKEHEGDRWRWLHHPFLSSHLAVPPVSLWKSLVSCADGAQAGCCWAQSWHLSAMHYLSGWDLQSSPAHSHSVVS